MSSFQKVREAAPRNEESKTALRGFWALLHRAFRCSFAFPASFSLSVSGCSSALFRGGRSKALGAGQPCLCGSSSAKVIGPSVQTCLAAALQCFRNAAARRQCLRPVAALWQRHSDSLPMPFTSKLSCVLVPYPLPPISSSFSHSLWRQSILGKARLPSLPI